MHLLLWALGLLSGGRPLGPQVVFRSIRQRLAPIPLVYGVNVAELNRYALCRLGGYAGGPPRFPSFSNSPFIDIFVDFYINGPIPNPFMQQTDFTVATSPLVVTQHLVFNPITPISDEQGNGILPFSDLQIVLPTDNPVDETILGLLLSDATSGNLFAALQLHRPITLLKQGDSFGGKLSYSCPPFSVQFSQNS